MSQWIHGSSFLGPRCIISATAGPEGAKNLAGESPPPDSNPFSDAESAKNLARLSRKIRSNPELPIPVP
jgi:hypothetical protein